MPSGLVILDSLAPDAQFVNHGTRKICPRDAAEMPRVRWNTTRSAAHMQLDFCN